MPGLGRLRFGFVLLGALLLLPLLLLLREAEARFEFQRRLRHEIVAERVFDEMERELTALLEHERGRPSSAYDNPQTQVDRWSPFVVGYFRYDGNRLHLPAEAQLSDDRKARVTSAVGRAEASGGLLALLAEQGESATDGGPKAAAEQQAAAREQDRDDDVRGLGLERNVPKKQASQAAVLRQLNRARSTRTSKERKLKGRQQKSRKATSRNKGSNKNTLRETPDSIDDPLSGAI